MLNTVHNLTGLLAEFWKKIIKEESATSASHISKGDIVIFVVGPTGSGKSWFIKEATKCDLIRPSRSQHPCTESVQAIRCELTDEAMSKVEPRGGVESIVFVDTPSFLTECDRFDARKEVELWISQTKFEPLHNAGVIYMHRVETDPEYEPIKNHLEELFSIQKIGNGCFRRLLFVLSYDKSSSNVPEIKIAERRSKLSDQVDMWKSSRGAACRIPTVVLPELFQGDPDTAWRAVGELFGN